MYGKMKERGERECGKWGGRKAAKGQVAWKRGEHRIKG